MPNQSFTSQPNSEGENKHLVQKAFCIKTGKAKQLEEKMCPRMAEGAAPWKGTWHKQLQAASEAQRERRGRRSHPRLLPGLSVTPKTSPALRLRQEGPQTCSQEWASRGMAGELGQQEGQGAPGRAEGAKAREPRREVGMHRAAPAGLRPLRAVTYSFRAREFPVALARGIQIDIFTLTSLLTGVFTLRETG